VDFTWAIWVEWPDRADWTVRDGAIRLRDSVRLINQAWPGLVDEFSVRTEQRRWGTDTPGVVDRLAGALVGRRAAPEGAMFDRVHTLLFPAGPDRMSIRCDQGSLHVDFYRPSAEFLTRDPAAVARLIGELCAVWDARNGWLDMVHVRQEWNRWRRGLPVYGWATWLHPRFATVDGAGLDVDVTDTPDGGRRLVLRVDPAAMADPAGDAGRDTVEALIRRTVLADGRRLAEANPSLAS